MSISSGPNIFSEGDLMLPLWSNPNQVLYSDFSVKYGDEQAWLASVGLGNRSILRNIILGGYLFIDRNKTSNASYFTVLDPGVEFMANQWDGHLNGYLPIGSKNKLIGISTGSQLGISNTNFFSGHTQYDILFNQVENVGPGLDLEIGHIFNSSYFNKTRLFAGGYYFNPNYISNMHGVEAGFEVPLQYKGASVELRDSYDNVTHNTLLLTLRFTFGGLETVGVSDIHNRMLDRIPRHLANLYNGNGIPSGKRMVRSGKTIINDNIWFFNANGTPSVIQGSQNCTFEHPCDGLAQAQIDTINSLAPNANFYLNSGSYNNSIVGAGFTFYSGQNIFGRTNNFALAADSNNRPLLNDSLILNGNNNIYNVQIHANSALNIAINGITPPIQTGVLVMAPAVGIVNIYNTEIASVAAPTVAAVINNSPTATLNIGSSTLISRNTLSVPAGMVIGVNNVSSGTLNLNQSSINVEASLINHSGTA